MLTVQGACALRSPVNTARMATAIAKIVTGARSVAEREARRDTRRQHGIVVAEPRWQPGRDPRRQHRWTALGRRLRYGPAGASRDELPAGAPRPIAVAVAAVVIPGLAAVVGTGGAAPAGTGVAIRLVPIASAGAGRAGAERRV